MIQILETGLKWQFWILYTEKVQTVKFQGIPSQRRRLADDAYDQIVAAIARRDVGPEDVLIQEKLADEMRISRTPVREALMRLAQEGVLEVSRRGSFRLYRLEGRDIEELYQARTAVEGQCAGILAERRDPFDIVALREVVVREEAANDAGPQGYFEAHRHIHRAFVERAGNRFLLDMFDTIWAKGMAFHLFSAKEVDQEDGGLTGHMALVEAIADGDGPAALLAMSDHIAQSCAAQVAAADRPGGPGQNI